MCVRVETYIIRNVRRVENKKTTITVWRLNLERDYVSKSR